MEAGSDKLALFHCSCLHACLAAYSNILRRALNVTCIIINRGVWRHGRGPISGRSDELGSFWSKPSVKSWDKNHMSTCTLVLVKYCDLLDWIRAKWLGIDRKIVPVSEKLRRDPWGFRQQGWSAPTEIDINDGEWRLFDISSASTSGVWDWMAVIETVIDIATLADGWSRLKTEDYKVVSAQLGV